eukprot:1151027-Pelagomonas_calceolata.AAC.6
MGVQEKELCSEDFTDRICLRLCRIVGWNLVDFWGKGQGKETEPKGVTPGGKPCLPQSPLTHNTTYC